MTTVLVRISSLLALTTSRRSPARTGRRTRSSGWRIGFAPQLLDHREVHHLIERRLLGDRVDLLVEEVRRVPGALEVRRVVLVQEELAVLRVVGRVRVAEHAERVALGNRVAGGHQLRDLLLGVLRLQVLHRVEDAADQASMMSGLSLAKSARANQTSAISLLAVAVVTIIRLPLTFSRL